MGLVSSQAVPSWPGSPRCCVFGGVFGVRRGFAFFFCVVLFLSKVHGLRHVSDSLVSLSSLLLTRPFFVNIWVKKPRCNEARSRERIDRGRFLPVLFIAGCVQTSIISVCRSVFLLCAVCQRFFRNIIDCESCTWPTSTNPAFEEAGELRLTRGTCFAVRRLELAAVVVPLCLWRCVLGAAVFVLIFVAFPANAHGLRDVSGSLAAFTFISTGVRTGLHHLISLIVYFALCGQPRLLIARAVPGRFPPSRRLHISG